MCPAVYSLMENLTTETFEDGGKMEIDVHDLIGNAQNDDKYVRSYHLTIFTLLKVNLTLVR